MTPHDSLPPLTSTAISDFHNTGINLSASVSAFISGHTDLTLTEFEREYRSLLDKAISRGHHFVIGHSAGADTMALDYLSKNGVKPSQISIYIYDRYSTGLAQGYRDLGLKVFEGYQSYNSRDGAMTQNSDYDILWVHPEAEARALMGDKYSSGHMTGTERNLQRRQQMNSKKMGHKK